MILQAFHNDNVHQCLLLDTDLEIMMCLRVGVKKKDICWSYPLNPLRPDV